MADESKPLDWINHHEMASSFAPLPPATPFVEPDTAFIQQFRNDCKPPLAKATDLSRTTITLDSSGTTFTPGSPATTITDNSVGSNNSDAASVAPPSNQSYDFPLLHLDRAEITGANLVKPTEMQPNSASQTQEKSSGVLDWISHHKLATTIAVATLAFCSSSRLRNAAVRFFEGEGEASRVGGQIFHDYEQTPRAAVPSFFESIFSSPSRTSASAASPAVYFESTGGFAQHETSPFLERLGLINTPGAEPDRIFHSSTLPVYHPHMTTFVKDRSLKNLHRMHQGGGNPLTMNWGKIKF
jgi:hypothetical protein